MNYSKLSFLLIILLLATVSFGQNVDRFGRQQETALDFSALEQQKDLMGQSQSMQALQPENMVMTPVEKAIDPSTYIVGPGDQFAININSIEQLSFTAYVGPTGDILIPTVGVVNVNGSTLSDALESIEKFIIDEGYKTADVYITLLSVRYFKIQIAGAVNNPGFYMVTPLTRLDEIVEMTMGFHPFAKQDSIIIRKNIGGSEVVDFTNFLYKGDLADDPCFVEGDFIFVPFDNRINADLASDEIIQIYTDKGVSVNGYVQVPGSYKFFAGYTVADYIGLAGGNSKEGNAKKAYVKHEDGTLEKGMDVVIQPGDQIIVPRSIAQWIVGNSSIGQLIISAASVYMSYLAATN